MLTPHESRRLKEFIHGFTPPVSFTAMLTASGGTVLARVQRRLKPDESLLTHISRQWSAHRSNNTKGLFKADVLGEVLHVNNMSRDPGQDFPPSVWHTALHAAVEACRWETLDGDVNTSHYMYGRPKPSRMETIHALTLRDILYSAASAVYPDIKKHYALCDKPIRRFFTALATAQTYCNTFEDHQSQMAAFKLVDAAKTGTNLGITNDDVARGFEVLHQVASIDSEMESLALDVAGKVMSQKLFSWTSSSAIVQRNESSNSQVEDEIHHKRHPSTDTSITERAPNLKEMKTTARVLDAIHANDWSMTTLNDMRTASEVLQYVLSTVSDPKAAGSVQTKIGDIDRALAPTRWVTDRTVPLCDARDSMLRY